MRQRCTSPKRFRIRIRPGRLIIIPRPILRFLGTDPNQLNIEMQGNRLVVYRRPSPVEMRLARLKSRITSQR